MRKFFAFLIAVLCLSPYVCLGGGGQEEIFGQDASATSSDTTKVIGQTKNETITVSQTEKSASVPAQSESNAAGAQTEGNNKSTNAKDKKKSGGGLKKSNCTTSGGTWENDACKCKEGKELNKQGFCQKKKDNTKNNKSGNAAGVVGGTTDVAANAPAEDVGDKLNAAKTRTAAAKEKREAAEANYKEKKDIEQSKENRLLGAATIAATGVGGMELAQGLAEKKADEAAERDMTVYMATFRCDMGMGQNIKGGTTGVEIPGTATLAPIVAKYKALAADLKQRKEALGLKYGIESEVILDSANMGLYDDRAMAGERVGAFTSLYRALKDPEGKDAAEWNAQKEKSQKKIKGGAIALGAGVVGGIAGDLIINRDKNKDKDKEGKCKYPDEDKYADKKDKKTFACVVTDTELGYANNGELSSNANLADKANCEYVCKNKGWDVMLKSDSCATGFAPDKKNKSCITKEAAATDTGVLTGDATTTKTGEGTSDAVESDKDDKKDDCKCKYGDRCYETNYNMTVDCDSSVKDLTSRFIDFDNLLSMAECDIKCTDDGWDIKIKDNAKACEIGYKVADDQKSCEYDPDSEEDDDREELNFDDLVISENKNTDLKGCTAADVEALKGKGATDWGYNKNIKKCVARGCGDGMCIAVNKKRSI